MSVSQAVLQLYARASLINKICCGAAIALLATSILLVLPISASASPLCSDTWTGGGETTLWETPQNWSTGEVPSSASVTCIGQGVTVEISYGSDEADSLFDEGELIIDGGRLELANDVAESSEVASLDLETGGIGGPGRLTVSSELLWSSGAMFGAGETVLSSGATGDIDGETVALDERSLVNEGTLTSDATINGYAAEINNKGTFIDNEQVEAAAYQSYGLLSEGFGAPASVLHNTGTVKKTTGSLFGNIDFAVDNEGTIESRDGQLIFSDGTDGTNGPGGSWNASSEGALSFNDGQFKFGSEMRFSGVVVADTSLEAGTIRGTNKSKLILYLSDGSVKLTSGGTSHVETLEGENGTLYGPGRLEVESQLIWHGGRVAESATLVVGSAAAGAIDNDSTFSGEDVLEIEHSTLVNDGETQWSKGNILGYGAEVDNAGTLDVYAQAEAVDLASTGLLSEEGDETPPSVLRNTGTIEKPRGSLFMNIDFQIDNEGTILAKSGQIVLDNGTPEHTGTGGQWTARNEGSLSFNSGTFEFGATMNIAGTVVAYSQLVAGSIQGSGTVILYLSPGHMDLTSSSTISHVEALEVEGGTLEGPGTLEIGGSLTSNEGEWSGSGPVILASGATGMLAEKELRLFGRNFINRGTTTLKSGTIAMSGGSTLTNSGTFNANSEAGYPQIRVGAGGGSATIVNSGRFDKTAGGGTTAIEPSFENRGSTHAFTGKLSFLNPTSDVKASTQYGSSNLAALGPGHPSCGKPVDCITGNETETQTDIEVGGRGGVPLSLTRYYNAQAAAAGERGMFGYGWSNSFSNHVVVSGAEHTATVVQENGSTVTFGEAEGAWVAPAWTQDRLAGSEAEGFTLTPSDQTTYRFTGSGRLESIVDSNGNETTLTYDEAGRLTKIANPSGRAITLAYNSEGLVESATDPIGHTVSYAYEDADLTSVTMPGEAKPRWQFGYNGSHLMTSMTNGLGGETTNEYNGSNQVVKQRSILGDVIRWEYEPFKTKITNEASGAITVEDYNSYDELTSIAHAYGMAEETTNDYTYNEAGEVVSEVNGVGATTSYEYNEVGDRVKEVKPEEQETKWTYDSRHEVTSETLPSGETTSIEYDVHGNPIKISRPAPGAEVQETHYEYNSHGALTTVVDPLGHEWSFGYDEAGDLTSEVDPEGDRTTWAYNEDGQRTSEVSPRGNAAGAEPGEYTTTIERDNRGQPIKVIGPEGKETGYEYNAEGDVTAVKDADGHTTTTSYNAEGEPTEETQPSGATSETEYNVLGEVVAQINGDKDTTRYVYNPLGLVSEIVEPLERKTSESYNAAAELASVTNAEGQTTGYEYDKDGELASVSYTEAATHGVSYEYDADGQVSGMTDGTGTTSYSYDQLGRLTETGDGVGAKVGYAYNLANEIVAITYPNGKTVKDSYDSAGRLSSVTDWLGNTTSFGYNPASELTETRFPETSGETDRYSYDRAGEMSSVSMLKGSETLAHLGYARDAEGNVTKAVQEGLPGSEDTTYAYTSNGQLEMAGEAAYEYDAAGNPTKVEDRSGAFNAASELTEAGNTVYAYNQLGQRTKQTPTEGPSTSYAYDQAGNLVEVSRPEEGSTSKIEDNYAYNGEGLRTSETNDGDEHQLTWDLTNSLPLLLSNGTDSYIYGPEAQPIEQVASGNSEEHAQYLHHDQQDSTRLITSEKGETLGTYTYTPYGAEQDHEGTVATRLGYDGQYTSADTGLIYLRARTYDPSTGQFLSIDPAVLLTRSPYTYTNDDPLNNVDPFGLTSESGIGVPCFFPLCPPPPPASEAVEQLGKEVIEGGREVAEGIAHGAESIWNTVTGKGTKRNPAQDKKLTDREVEALEKAGFHPHDLKPGGSSEDLYRDREGNIYVKPKGGAGPGEPTGLNMKEFGC